MQFVNKMSIATKLPLALSGMAALMGLLLTCVAFFSSLSDLKRNTVEVLELIETERTAQLDDLFKSLESSMVAYSISPTWREALSQFRINASMIAGDHTAVLTDLYGTGSTVPAEQRADTADAGDGSSYSRTHAQYHDFFRRQQQEGGYYDVFLITTEGEIVYSVTKEADFATNLISGPYSGSGLGQAFRSAMEGASGRVYFSDFQPYAPSNGQGAAFMAIRVDDENGSATGVIAVQMPFKRITDLINRSNGLGETGEVYLIGSDMRYRSESRFEGGHQLLDEAPDLIQATNSLNGLHEVYWGTLGKNGNPVVSTTGTFAYQDVMWGVIVEENQSEAVAPVYSLALQLLLASLLGTAATGGGAWLLARSLTRPLKQIQSAVVLVAGGRYDAEVPATERADELGVLAKALVSFRENLKQASAAEQEREAAQKDQQRVVDVLSRGLGQLADGDLTQKIDEEFSPQYEALRENFNRTISNLDSAIRSVVDNAREISSRSQEISSASDDLSRRTETQAATLEQTAAALDELTASVKSAADGAKEVEKIVREARTDADNSGVIVQNAVSAMTEIEKSSSEISQIIGVIDDIAFQTNLLALNAGVEAARAGDAGRGFAVVASEVRALAQRSSDAARQIKNLIGGSTEQVERGVVLVRKAGEALTTIADRVAHISTLITEIASGAQEQSTGLGEINMGVTHLDQVTQQNAAMVEESTAGSHALKQEAAQLTDLVGQFQLSSRPSQGSASLVAKAALPAARPIRAGDIPTFTPKAMPRPQKLADTGSGSWHDF